jgi:outer membrane immunogenic protein
VTAVSLMLAGTAAAADLRRPMPVKAPAPAPVAAYNWTGCYVGAGGGYGMFNQEITPFNGPIQAWTSHDNGGRGWFGTVQVGCDYQVTSNIVIGAFADYDFSGIKGDITINPFLYGGEEKLKWSWAAGGRIGFIPFAQQQFMVFVSGGYTQARFGAVDLHTNGAPNGLQLDKHTYSGWFLGSGYEYAFVWFPGFTWKTEYRFADYSTDNVPIIFAANGIPTGLSIDSHKYVQTIRSELVWRFNFGGGARY